MPYIGSQQGTSAPVLLDAISVVNGQAAYTLQKGGLNYQPASTLVMQVSLNGIIQQPGGGSYTVEGSTITFASNLVTGDVIDYILVREPTTGTIAPLDASVTDSKIVSMAATKLTGALPAIDGSALTGVSAGKVLQVLQTVKSDTFTGAANTWHKITGLTQSITPTSTSSKILVSCQISTQDSNNYPVMFHIYRDDVKITPDGSGNPYSGNVTNAYAYLQGGNASNAAASATISFQFLDSPNTTSAIEYQVYGGKPNLAVSSLVINNANAGNMGSSVITLMEIEN